MDSLTQTGRILFAVAMAIFGAQCVLFASAAAWPLPGPPWTQTIPWLAWLTGVVLLATAICIALPWRGRIAASVLGVGILLRALLIYGAALVRHPRDPGPWTTAFELLALCGASFAIAATLPASTLNRSSAADAIMAGRYLFAISLVVFGVQHFMYARFVGMLVPRWIPWHLFWAYATGLVFFAAAASLLANRMVRPIVMLLGAMFLLWVVVLHAPRVAAASHDGNEWTSAVVALAMGGGALVLAGASSSASRKQGMAL